MYQKYTTDAIVLSSYESGEADRSIALLTRDFGLVRTRAISVRSEKSKMRYATQRFTLCAASLVRGKRGWRIAGAAARFVPTGSLQGIAAFARISELTLRLVAGEEKNEYLFDALAEAHRSLMQKDAAAVPVIEIVAA